MVEPISFLKPLAKVGDSLVIRVPKNATEYLKVNEGDVLHVSIAIPEENLIPEKLLLPYKKYFPELKNFTLNDLNSCMFYTSMEGCIEDKKMKEEFFKKIKKDKGEEFFKKYQIFKKVSANKEGMKKVVQESMKVSDEFKKSIEMSIGKEL